MEYYEADVEQNYIKGEMIYTIFSNEAEHFSIAKIKILETNITFNDDEIVIKGYFRKLDPGETYEFYGDFVEHKKFGKQFQVTNYQRFRPKTKDGIVAYLSSDLFVGIGKKTASNIVDHLGESAIEKILADKNCLKEIPRLNKDKAEKLYSALMENQGFEHIVLELSRFGFGLKMTQKIYQVYKDETLNKLIENPYEFVFNIEGFGFLRADTLAKQNGLPMNHPSRIQAACIYTLQNSIQDGHVYLPVRHLLIKMDELLQGEYNDINYENMVEELDKLNTEKRIILLSKKVYLPTLYYSEAGVCSHVKRLYEKKTEAKTDEANLLKIVGEIEEEESLSYSKDQFDAIKQALESKIMILTGGPGTGKTTVIKGILKAYAKINKVSLDMDDYEKKADFPFVLTAPTGRASKRMTESTGIQGQTIHRLLGWDGHETFEKDENSPLNGKLLVIDEFSMVDIWLAYQLFRAIPDEMQVLIVGDEDQLPSVGPGQVLADLMASEIIDFVQLTEVYRQKEGSKIIQLAHQIKQKKLVESDLNKANDFNFIECKEIQVVSTIKKIVKKAVDKGVDIHHFQILAPMYRTNAGIHLLNQELQAILNPPKKGQREMRMKDVVYRKGDKIIQLVNQPEDGVFNGDIGEVVAIFDKDESKDQEEQLVVQYDEKEVAYSRNDLLNVMHAYCTSIHKSQGSEFKIVILPVISAYRRMLRKNLLYTAITRAKQSLIICGDKNAFLTGVRTEDSNQRFTSLIEQLQEVFQTKTEEVNENSGYTLIESLDHVKVDDIQNLSPYDFM